MAKRRDYDRASAYAIKAASQDKQIPNPITWSNAIGYTAWAGHLRSSDSIVRVWAERAPTQPSQLLWHARAALYGHHDFARVEQTYNAIRPKLASSRTLTDNATGDLSTLMAIGGRLREGFQLAAELTARRVEQGRRVATLRAGLDSAELMALVEENPALARQVVQRALQRMSPDSLPLIERPYDRLLEVATYVGDTALARRTRADYQRFLVAGGKTIGRSAAESYADGLVEFATGHLELAVVKLDEADQRLLRCRECIAATKFLAFDRLGKTDSAIAAGEAYAAIRIPLTLNHEAMFRPGVLQRLGELYEAKGMPEKALPHYQEFVEQWKNADPELQPRVKDVRARIDRIRAQMAKKG